MIMSSVCAYVFSVEEKLAKLPISLLKQAIDKIVPTHGTTRSECLYLA
jgi:ribosomal protein S7